MKNISWGCVVLTEPFQMVFGISNVYSISGLYLFPAVPKEVSCVGAFQANWSAVKREAWVSDFLLAMVCLNLSNVCSNLGCRVPLTPQTRRRVERRRVLHIERFVPPHTLTREQTGYGVSRLIVTPRVADGGCEASLSQSLPNAVFFARFGGSVVRWGQAPEVTLV